MTETTRYSGDGQPLVVERRALVPIGPTPTGKVISNAKAILSHWDHDKADVDWLGKMMEVLRRSLKEYDAACGKESQRGEDR